MKTLVCAILVAGSVAIAGAQDAEKKKPSLTLRASPSAGFTPLRVVLTAELKGGDDDFAGFYCPTVEWVWGDDTRAESTADCDPYEPGKSKIRRRYTTTRIFQIPGDMKVEFRLKQKDKVVVSNSTRITVRPGLRDGGGDR
ncbi:MAG: hypothetical protein WD227_15815 [Vicinamibacterales bacterium]